jgi:hypothetical protein
MREQATGDRNSQAKIVWQRHLKEKTERRRCTKPAQESATVTLEQARAITRAAEISLRH